MAHIYVGDQSRVGEEVLQAVNTLPSDFWAFAEFNVTGRNIDWFIARAVPEDAPDGAHSTLILTEVKRVSRPIEGAVDTRWRTQADDGSWQEIVPSNDSDLNYYWQAVNAANSLNGWLWNNQQLYMTEARQIPQSEFKIWPDLLLLGPPGITHRLPIQPPSRFGAWYTKPDIWVNHIKGWTPRRGVALREHNLMAMAELLRLRPIQLPSEETMPSATPGNGLESFVAWLMNLEARVRRLEEQR